MKTQRRTALPTAAIIFGVGIFTFVILGAIAIGALLILTNTNDDAEAQTSTQANGNFDVYLHNSITNDVVRVDADGSTVTASFSVPEETFFESIAVQDNIAAYCLSQPAGDSRTFTLFVVDINSGSTIQTVDFGQATFCRVSPNAISTDGSSIAVAVVTIIEPQNVVWNIVALRISDGAIINEVTNSQTEFDQLERDRFHIMPDVRHFGDGKLFFAVIPWQTEGIPVDSAYEWDLGTDTIVQRAYWGNMQVDYLPATGETVWTEHDTNLPAGEAGGPIPNFNVVRLADAAGNISTIYTNGEQLPLNATFIDGGRAIAVLLMDAFDPNTSPGSQTTRYIRIDRSGDITELRDTNGQFVRIFPLMDSHAYIIQDGGPEALAYIEYPVDDVTDTLWENPSSGWRLVGHSEIMVNGSLPPFSSN